MTRIPARLRSRLSSAGFVAASEVPLARAGRSQAFRLDLADGRRVKLRIFPTTRAAADVFRLLGATGALLPRPIAQLGRAIVVEFIEGVPLDEHLAARGGRAPGTDDRAPFIAHVGRMLARLHRRSTPRIPARSVDAYGRELRRFVGELVRRGALDRARERRLRQLAPPEAARMVISHGDLSPSNLIVTPRGRVRAIDEERLAIRPLGFDVARAIVRWDLDVGEEARLVDAYRRAGGRARGFTAHRTFWMASALAGSAVYRLRYGVPGAARPLSRLRAV